jgi:hypothetical protein
VNTPFTTSWNASTIAYDVQNALRRSRFVRSTNKSRATAAPIPSTAASV